MNTTTLLLLIHIFWLGIPMLVASIVLFVVTLKIRRFLVRYNIQPILFRGIFLISYLFLLIAIAHIGEEVSEWYGYDILALEVGAVWHGTTVIVLLVVLYSFYQYLKTLKRAQTEG